jgi:hypothetical protein
MARCRARTERGTLCQVRVKKAGQRCRHHKGMPEAGPRPSKPSAQRRKRTPATARRNQSRTTRMRSTPPPKSNRRREQEAQRRRQQRIEEAAEACSDVLTDGWRGTVAARASDYVTETTWRRMFGGRRRRRCRLLAELASTILAGKRKLHDLVGSFASWIAAFAGAGDVTRTFARELASAIPLPPDAKLAAVARGLQVTGVLLCVVDGEDLTRCQCFIDLALAESKTMVKKILVAAMDDWTGLAGFPPKEPRPART